MVVYEWYMDSEALKDNLLSWSPVSSIPLQNNVDYI